MIKLKNSYISIFDSIDVVISDSYLDKDNIKNLKEKVKNIDRQVVKNKATGKESKICSKTIGKILYPSSCKNIYTDDYLYRLNASLYIEKLFENAIYIDTYKPMKGKENNSNYLGYHHFISLIYMNNSFYKVFITVVDKKLSSTIYLSDVKIFNCKLSIYDDVPVYVLFENSKLYDYVTKKNIIYSSSDYVCEGFI